MKFDYKPKNKKIGSPICRRTLHVTLGFAAFVCLALGLTLGRAGKSAVQTQNAANTITNTKSATTVNVNVALVPPKPTDKNTAAAPIQSAQSTQSASSVDKPSSTDNTVTGTKTHPATSIPALALVTHPVAGKKGTEVTTGATKASPENKTADLTTTVAQTIAQPATPAILPAVPQPAASNDAIPATNARVISSYERLISDLPPLEIEGLPKLAANASNDKEDEDEAEELRIPETQHNIKVRHKDTLAKIFNRLGVSTKDIHEILTTDPASKNLASLQQGQTLKLRVTKDKQVAGLTLDIAPGNSLIVSRNEEGFDVEHKILPLEKHLAFSKAQIRSSLFTSAKKAGLDSKLISQMTEIFGSNIDFSLDLKPSDTFRVLYEEKCLNGERIETGNILVAEIVNGSKKLQAIRYTDKSGRTGYFSPDGYGLNLAFLRSPVNYSNISSNFGMRRHPCLHRMRAHKGTDYKAPHGAEVFATGQGKVIFIGNRGGYGKVIKLQHGPRYSTLYAHLSRFAKGLKLGSTVTQGQVIGYVGATGLATGAHLHYEFLVDEVHRDPTRVTLPRKNPLDEKSKRHFLAHSKEMLRLLDLHDHKVKMASNDFLINE